ncbi:MAG: 23S rRNA (adenine(2503)-C(2))-methyltransferase RlmN [Candidatus Abyssubacteria bacterium]|nr:23S rRNA (adenine(2503)-C(2))-methyltransferase RlmN [Candidatus Abyssubacteria bacterium]
MTKSAKNKPDLLDLLPEEIDRLFGALGIEPYRTTQIVQWLYTHGARSFGEMTNLPKGLRDKLSQEYRITDLKPIETLVSRRDRTKKFLLELSDGAAVETVPLPEGQRSTACLSTQVGCSFGCVFCASGKDGFKRNLSAGEIVDQARRARFDPDAGRLTNIVLMGMGEPLANYPATAKAVRIFQHKRCFGIGKRRVTISTAGYVPGIRRLAEDDLPVRLAISLHAPDDKTRSRLMPINRKYPIKELLGACRPLAGKPQTPLTIEYMLMDGVNDSMQQARKLAEICRPLEAKVNLITYNPALTEKFAAPPREKVLRFQSVLREAGLLAFIRRSRGLDIHGACGQLGLRSIRHPHKNSV